jgi:hypothetical protein
MFDKRMRPLDMRNNDMPFQIRGGWSVMPCSVAHGGIGFDGDTDGGRLHELSAE